MAHLSCISGRRQLAYINLLKSQLNRFCHHTQMEMLFNERCSYAHSW